jgi:hypothetical protein
VAVKSPSIMFARCLEIISPRPVPFSCASLELVLCTYGRKYRSLIVTPCNRLTLHHPHQEPCSLMGLERPGLVPCTYNGADVSQSPHLGIRLKQPCQLVR